MEKGVHNQSIQSAQRHHQTLPEVAWEDVQQPGCYVDQATGDLFRIPVEGLVTGASPIVVRESAEPIRLRQLSVDPFLPTLKARLLCAQNNIQPNF
jgi:hypothetical protein